MRLDRRVGYRSVWPWHGQVTEMPLALVVWRVWNRLSQWQNLLIVPWQVKVHEALPHLAPFTSFEVIVRSNALTKYDVQLHRASFCITLFFCCYFLCSIIQPSYTLLVIIFVVAITTTMKITAAMRHAYRKSSQQYLHHEWCLCLLPSNVVRLFHSYSRE